MNALTGFGMVRGLANVASVAGALDPGLPSITAARRVWLGQPHALPMVAASVGMRAVIIAIGLSVAGYRGRQMAWGSLASSAMIEAYVLTWTYRQVRRAKFALPQPPPPQPLVGQTAPPPGGGRMAGLPYGAA